MHYLDNFVLYRVMNNKNQYLKLVFTFTCIWIEPFVSDRFSGSNEEKAESQAKEIPRQYSQREEMTELKGDDSRSSLHLSSSSPSLTEYVRQHLCHLQIGAGPVLGLPSPLSAQDLAAGAWNPQYGSPKLTSPSPPSSSVVFTLGDVDEELLAVNSLNLTSTPTDIQFQFLERNSHHFCSMIQRTSTTPDLQSQVVSCLWFYEQNISYALIFIVTIFLWL